MANQTTRVTVLKEVSKPVDFGDLLCFQEVVYVYPDLTADHGYRFIRKGSDGKLRAQRGQANVVTPELAIELAGQLAAMPRTPALGPLNNPLL